MHGRGLATTANMTQTVCDTVFLLSCAMQVLLLARNKRLLLHDVTRTITRFHSAMESFIRRPAGAALCRCS